MTGADERLVFPKRECEERTRIVSGWDTEDYAVFVRMLNDSKDFCGNESNLGYFLDLNSTDRTFLKASLAISLVWFDELLPYFSRRVLVVFWYSKKQPVLVLSHIVALAPTVQWTTPEEPKTCKL